MAGKSLDQPNKNNAIAMSGVKRTIAPITHPDVLLTVLFMSEALSE
jgi:hypothetical protein